MISEVTADIRDRCPERQSLLSLLDSCHLSHTVANTILIVGRHQYPVYNRPSLKQYQGERHPSLFLGKGAAVLRLITRGQLPCEQRFL